MINRSSSKHRNKEWKITRTSSALLTFTRDKRRAENRQWVCACSSSGWQSCVTWNQHVWRPHGLTVQPSYWSFSISIWHLCVNHRAAAPRQLGCKWNKNHNFLSVLNWFTNQIIFLLEFSQIIFLFRYSLYWMKKFPTVEGWLQSGFRYSFLIFQESIFVLNGATWFGELNRWNREYFLPTWKRRWSTKDRSRCSQRRRENRLTYEVWLCD